MMVTLALVSSRASLQADITRSSRLLTIVAMAGSLGCVLSRLSSRNQKRQGKSEHETEFIAIGRRSLRECDCHPVRACAGHQWCHRRCRYPDYNLTARYAPGADRRHLL